MPRKQPHPESLLRVPLVRHVFRDPIAKLRVRAVDARWKYENEIEFGVGGFNPLESAIFYPRHSHLERWLRDTRGSARKHNEQDRLVGEVMFMVHDYLHIWAYHWIAALRPSLRFGRAPISKRNFEDLAFAHMVTEAVATVGLDYWYLSTVSLNDVCNIGTDFSELTVSYREERADEYRRFNPRLKVQHPRFFGDICKFYCTGEFFGFDRSALRKSPRVLFWLSHELSYGVSQREYIRGWLAYLSREGAPPGRLDRRISFKEKWKKQLIDQIGELLWRKVKHDELLSPPPAFPRRDTWKAPVRKELDFRFVNWNAIRGREKRHREQSFDERNFRFFLNQFLSQYDYERLDRPLLGLTREIFTRRDIELAEFLFRGQRKVRAVPNEPRDLFLPN